MSSLATRRDDWRLLSSASVELASLSLISVNLGSGSGVQTERRRTSIGIEGIRAEKGGTFDEDEEYD